MYEVGKTVFVDDLTKTAGMNVAPEFTFLSPEKRPSDIACKGAPHAQRIPFYRENLEQILEFSKGRQLLSATDVKNFCGIDARTAKKLFPFTGNHISAATLAAAMSQTSSK